MTYYGFELGRNGALSMAELAALLPTNNIIGWTREVLVVAGPLPCPEADFFRRLGGAIRMMRLTLWPDDDYVAAVQTAAADCRFPKHKILWGVNAWGAEPGTVKELVQLGKQHLQAAGHSVRFINDRFHNLTSAQTYKSHILRDGLEFNLVSLPAGRFVGPTIAVQDLDAYRVRDYEKPARNSKNGMLPPKLAQILINLTGAVEPSVLYDPFCGNGTVPMEAALMGHDYLASDNDPRCIRDTNTNLTWLTDKFQLSPPLAEAVWLADATAPYTARLKFDHLVSEGFLGPNWSQQPAESEVLAVVKRLEKLYSDFFRAIAPVTPATGKMVICMPSFPHAGGAHTLRNLPRVAKELGWVGCSLLPEELATFWGCRYPTFTINYARPGQFVERAISVWRRA